MEKCEFEEKEFEAVLYQQLGSGSSRLWAPGQVLESKIGIDYSMFSSNLFFWALHGFNSLPAGVALHTRAHYFPTISRPLPNFSLNLFIQAKRPNYLVRAVKKLKRKGLSSPFWRFATVDRQQTRLGSLSAALGSDAIVCYAAPAFHRVLQLYAHTNAGTVVENSTFPTVAMLKKPHKAWNYSQPGVTGVANAEPEFHQKPLLEVQIDQLYEARKERLGAAMPESLQVLSSSLKRSIDMEELGDDSRAALFNVRRQQVDSMFAGSSGSESDLLRDYLHVHNYATTFNMLWLTIGERRG